ncbi:clathrin heavy chain linker domain-containing protein 1-like [Solea solea]|uniref:clathrin heavy chain linker domain-containing protein 1-like n=1 Tax=Solea solea TaxID=90069 RepID=UPI00272DC4C5|nr:clathrin heavy chain linker domain-containing protein 1-like [Solea solea]
MSEPQKSKYNKSPRLREDTPRATPDILVCEREERFFKSLYEFIEHEKQFLQCPAEGADELRYAIYRSAFNKVICRATAYKRLLSTIKTEYDDIVVELKRREDDVRATQQILTTSASQSRSLYTCRRRRQQLKDRICELQTETSRLKDEVKRRKSWTEQRRWIPGLTVAESQDPEALDRQLRRLQAQRTALLDTRSCCVSLDVKDQLDAELRTRELRRDELSTENKRLNVLWRRLRSVCGRLSHWEDDEQQVPLEDLLSSTLEDMRLSGETDGGDVELFEDEEPSGVDESELVNDHVIRFMEFLSSAQYEDAALLAARSPQGVLRNLDVMELFKGVSPPPGLAPPGSASPLLLFFQALLVTVPPGVQLSPSLSSQCVLMALRDGALRLLTHAVTQNKLSFSEQLGDVLTEHAQQNMGVADQCLALASVVYEACGRSRKSALSMCRRGLIHSAAEFMEHNLTTDDIIWVLCRSPSLSLLQLLTERRSSGRCRRAAILSVGVACSTLLAADPPHQEVALQLLDGLVQRGREVLEDVVLEDSGFSVDTWTDIASLCSTLRRDDLSRTVLAVLLNQSGTGVLTPDLDGARLMEHVFL